MDKSILKKFAIESRQDLMSKISNKIKTFYVDEEFKKEQKGEVYLLSNEKHSLSLTKEENEKRDLLIKRINELTLEQVIEEAAYTWFNRLIAIRYMEINDMLPLTKNNSSLGIRVLSSKDNTPDPEILKFTNLTNPDLDIDFRKEKYVELKDDNNKFKYVLLLICKKLGKVIPQVFDGNTDYIDILILDSLLNEAGFITKIINDVPEENYNQVEIIGWLYQYYNQTEKDRVISAKKTYKKNEIPYATQLFTPDWIVKYMVENSLGRYWVEHNGDGALYPSNELYPSDNLYPSSSITDNWKYFIKDNIEKQEDKLKPTEITFIDPCCGSGHILVYAFEVFYQIYIKAGYNKNDIPELILKNNIYGLDIDDRAGQLSILSVLLKAREYDKNIFNKDVVKNLNIMSIQESTNISEFTIEGLPETIKEKAVYLKTIFANAKEIGSLLLVEKIDYSDLIEYINSEITFETTNLREYAIPLIKAADILSNKYNVVVTNPPYLSNNMMSKKLKDYLLNKYSDYKYDTFSSFIIRNTFFGKSNSLISYMTPNVWMYISSYERLRKYILENNSIISFVELGKGAFFQEATVDICSFVISKQKNNSKGIYYKLPENNTGMTGQEELFLKGCKNDSCTYKFLCDKNIFYNIPGNPLAFWLSQRYFDIFKEGKELSSFGDTRQGMATSDVNRFTKLWYEIEYNKIGFNYDSLDNTNDGRHKWFPYIKGGKFRKWSGNYDTVVNWEFNGKEVKKYAADLYKSYTRTIKNINYYFRESLSWGMITSGDISVRYYEPGYIFDIAGCCLFSSKEYLNYLLAFMNTKICKNLTKAINPTINMNVGDIAHLPMIYNKEIKLEIDEIVKENIKLSKQDWDLFETSWDFKRHPLLEFINSMPGLHAANLNIPPTHLKIIKNNYGKEQFIADELPLNAKIKDAFRLWNDYTIENFKTLKKNEEELNEIFIDIYGLQDELTPEVLDKDVTIRKADKLREIKSLISYAVGCMFGRYSLDEEGLVYAGGEFDSSKYKTFNADMDNIIPITDESYFNDDIVTRFKQFIETVYGKETLNENMDYIAETLGKKGTETSEDTIRRYFVNDFYNDHIKTYQKRPIYWLFDSGKKNGFKCLIYMHRYSKDLVASIRTKYIPKVQTTYEKLLSDVEYRLSTELSLNDKKEMEKRKIELNGKIQEVKEYYEKIANVANRMIDIDLDDGVVVNYAKFTYLNPKTNKEESILGKIK